MTNFFVLRSPCSLNNNKPFGKTIQPPYEIPNVFLFVTPIMRFSYKTKLQLLIEFA